MTLNEFVESLSHSSAPIGLTDELTALWIEARGDWDRAHRIVQKLYSADAAWVHAYMHRKEGDIGNASYWYARAGRNESHADFDTEWREIAEQLLQSV